MLLRKKSIFIFSLIFLFAPLISMAAFNYVPMEEIPGFGRPSDFPSYIMAVYKFGLWTVGIAAVLMIMIGGYMYLTSAGNTSQTGKAKGIITDAIAGVILALVSWLLLYTINPDLIRIKPLTTIPGAPGTGAPGTGTPGTGTGTNSGIGNCVPVANGPCSVASLQNTCFGSNAQQASIICMRESSGNQTAASTMDYCQPGGERVSFGLFQINISANSVSGLNCPSAFSNTYTGSNKNCTIINPALYQQCITAATNPAINIQTACGLSNSGNNFQTHWVNTCNSCGGC